MSTHGAANATSMGPSPPGPAGGRPGKSDPAAAARRRVRDALNHQAAEEVWFAVVASFIFVLTFIRFVDLLAQWYRRKHMAARIKDLQETKEVDALPASSTSGRVALRRIPLALLAAFRVAVFRTTIPVGRGSTVTIADGLTIAAYYAAILTFDFVRTSMGASGPQRFYYMDRAAFIGAAQIPLVVALAGKNNVVSWLTGISHEKLNVIHRAGGRILTLLFWLHGIARTKNGLTFVKGLETTWMKAGVLALTALTLTFIVGLRPIRRRFFEFFLISHIITVTLFIAGGYVHRPDVKYYFWPGFLVWGLDRALRVGRIVLFNFRLWRSGDKISTAHVELAADNTVLITASRPMNWKAGQHAYIVMPSVSLFPLEAHPFTIASIPGNVDGTETTGDNELLFLVHGEDGFTQRLRNHVSAAGQGDVTCYIDGPYGLPPALVTFDTVVLVAGGTGITYTLPLLLDAVRNAKLGRSVVRRIVFVWAIRNVADLKWIYGVLSEALAVAPEPLVIEPRIFVTRGDTSLASIVPSEDSSSKGEDNEKSDFDPLQTPLRVESGRPDIDSLLRSEIAAADGGRVSVDVAGPASLAAAVRSTLRSSAAGPSAVLRGGASVSLHIETFSH